MITASLFLMFHYMITCFINIKCICGRSVGFGSAAEEKWCSGIEVQCQGS